MFRSAAILCRELVPNAEDPRALRSAVNVKVRDSLMNARERSEQIDGRPARWRPVKLTCEEDAALMAAASRHHMTVSELARVLLLDGGLRRLLTSANGRAPRAD